MQASTKRHAYTVRGSSSVSGNVTDREIEENKEGTRDGDETGPGTRTRTRIGTGTRARTCSRALDEDGVESPIDRGDDDDEEVKSHDDSGGGGTQNESENPHPK